MFYSVISVAIDTYVPFFKNTRHILSPKLYPKNVRKLLQKKRSCWKLHRHFRTGELHDKYKAISACCSKAIMNCIVTHENNLVADGRLGKFYKYVNNKLNGSNGIGSLKSPSGEMLYSDRDKAVLLNDYFSSCMRRFLRRSSGSDANGKKNFVDDGLEMNVNLCFTNKQFDVINKKKIATKQCK